MNTIYQDGFSFLCNRIIGISCTVIAEFLRFRTEGSQYFDQSGKQFYLLPSVQHLADRYNLKLTTAKRQFALLKENGWIKTERLKCFDGAVRLKIYITEKYKALVEEMKSLHLKGADAVNDKSQATEKPKAQASHKIDHEMNQPIQPQMKEAATESLESIDNRIDQEPVEAVNKEADIDIAKILESQLNLEKSDSDESVRSDSDFSYIKEHTKKENNNNVNNTVGNTKSKENKIESYQNNVTSVSFDLNFLKAFECPDYGNECKKVIDKIALDNDVCDQNLAIIILELAELQVYRSNKQLVDDAITLAKRIANKAHKVLPSGEGHSLGKILKASPVERMKQLTPIQVLSVSKMLDYLENKKGVYLTNKQEVFSWIEYQLINPEHHFRGLSFRHALNVISKSLQARGALGYSKPYGYVA